MKRCTSGYWLRHLRDGAVCVCGIDEMGATDRHWLTGPGCSFVGTPKPRDHECSKVRSPRFVYDHLHYPLPATIDTFTTRKPLWAPAPKATGRVFAVPPSRSTRGVQDRLSLPSLSVQCKLSPRSPQLYFGRPILQYRILKFARVPSRLSDQRKGRMRRCTRNLRAVAYHQLMIRPRPALRFWPSPKLSSLCTRVE